MRTVIYVLGFALSACHSVYVPNGRNSPMFSGDGELQMSGALTTGDFASGLSGKNLDFDFQTAFSLTEHLGLMGNYSLTDAGHHYRHPPLYRHHWFAEGGIGYYSNTDKTCFEIFSGFGRGYGNTTYEDKCSFPIPDPDTRYARFFLQPALGWKGRYHLLSIISRFSIVHFSKYGPIQEPASVFFFEPGVLGKFNMVNNRLYIKWQAGFSMSASDGYPGSCLDHVPVNFSFGLGGQLGACKKKGTLPDKKNN
jgi:hypothetical protein